MAAKRHKKAQDIMYVLCMLMAMPLLGLRRSLAGSICTCFAVFCLLFTLGCGPKPERSEEVPTPENALKNKGTSEFSHSEVSPDELAVIRQRMIVFRSNLLSELPDLSPFEDLGVLDDFIHSEAWVKSFFYLDTGQAQRLDTGSKYADVKGELLEIINERSTDLSKVERGIVRAFFSTGAGARYCANMDEAFMRSASPRHSILNSLRLLDAAKDQFALENNRTSGTVTGAQVANYLKYGSSLMLAAEAAESASHIQDPNHPSVIYSLNAFGQLPSVSGTPTYMWEVTDANFWSPFPAR